MENSTIGIRIANGTFYPILTEDDRVKKKLVLSPVKEKQKDVKIDVFRGEGMGMYNPIYVGSLVLNNISHEKGKIPDIELLISINDDSILDIEAFESKSGVKQFLSVSLDSIDSHIGFYGMEDSPPEDSVRAPHFASDFEEKEDDADDEESGEEEGAGAANWSYNEGESKKKKGKLIVIILLILLLILLGLLAYALIMKPAFFAKSEESAPVAPVVTVREPEPIAPPQPPVQPLPVEQHVTQPEPTPEPPAVAQPTPAPEPVAPPPAQPEKKSEDIVYIIKWGDTLWDISNTFYRTPWLFRKIARDNNIRNPDRIYAGHRLIIKPE